jgi:multiple antibiotic resistance protein
MDPAADFLLVLVPLFVVVDPLASIGLYLGLTSRYDARRRARVAVKAVLFATIVLFLFTFAGQAMLRYVGIELYSLRVAGGILLTLIGLNMLREGQEIPASELDVTTGGKVAAESNGHDPSFVPLGLPMLAGPGAISLVILQGSQHDVGTASGAAIMGGAILVTMVGSLLILLAAARASHVIGENGRRVITRIMGILTVAFAVQYIFDGINGWLAAR